MNSRGIRAGRNVSNTHLPRPWNELRAHFALEGSPLQGVTSPSNIRLGSLTFYPTADFRSKRTEPDRNCGRSRDDFAGAAAFTRMRRRGIPELSSFRQRCIVIRS